MLKALFLPLLLSTTATTAQTDCAKPVIRLLHNGQEISSAVGSALVPSVTLQVAPEAGCPEQRYRFRNAEVTLIRKGRPALPSLKVSQPQLDLRYFLNHYIPGDYLFVFIAYQNVALVSGDCSLTPLRSLKDAKSNPGQLDLRTDDAKGISFRWPLQKP
ncbi:hypothetical protein J0X19_00315 [Hymenobacter sp. BT186]|uniref:Uncharacterized protein n=1 Tax=Hymenobacter telluris TaxID=2816474 RepID=A0A939ESM3_9BACT|nr:hypothetical protein [Hymenobacter telluris]MBO0356374.1 hypothetical protein [Hymenobacter telluris]MBW3372398.1 hypothetical protein [Hymenobacter norwichensis]